jgi:hypothetical protein
MSDQKSPTHSFLISARERGVVNTAGTLTGVLVIPDGCPVWSKTVMEILDCFLKQSNMQNPEILTLTVIPIS